MRRMIKRQTLLKITKDKLWRTIIDHVLKGHGTYKKSLTEYPVRIEFTTEGTVYMDILTIPSQTPPSPVSED